MCSSMLLLLSKPKMCDGGRAQRASAHPAPQAVLLTSDGLVLPQWPLSNHNGSLHADARPFSEQRAPLLKLRAARDLIWLQAAQVKKRDSQAQSQTEPAKLFMSMLDNVLGAHAASCAARVWSSSPR